MEAGRRASRLLALLTCAVARAQLRYAVPEELERGSVVADLAADLGLDAAALAARRFRVAGGPGARLGADPASGALVVRERIDREETCEGSSACVVHAQVVLENPLELYRVDVEVLDVNDHAPGFARPRLDVEISEAAAPGARFPLECAHDADAGANGLRTYLLGVNEHFALDVQTRGDGGKFAELVLRRPLDRERRRAHELLLTAVDGGTPARTGTAQVRVTVLDANDNAPAFERPFYRVRVAEDAPRGAVLVRLNASDADEGANADVTYSFSGHAPAGARRLFVVDARSGEVRLAGALDYERARLYEIYVQARDSGPAAVAVHCKVLVHVLDVNDNEPEVTLTSVSAPVPEDAPPGTVVAVVSVTDLDSGDNGAVHCEIPRHVPFRLHSSFANYYTLVTSARLDREHADAYNVTLTARDSGSPPLLTRRSVAVRVADVNDNAPRFRRPSYAAYVAENNAPGASVCAVVALDADAGDNARVTYALLDGDVGGDAPASAYVSVNADSGGVYARRSFDRERLASFRVTVEARDAGTPPLRTNTTVTIHVLDVNDNAPLVAAAEARDGDVAVPRTADAGHLATTIRATDADAARNARLSFELLRASAPDLFAVGLYTGEVRTARAVARGDAARHRLLVLVKDGGQPPLSSTASVAIALVEPDIRREPEVPLPRGPDLTVCLAAALGAVSLACLVVIVVLVSVRRAAEGRRCWADAPGSPEVVKKSRPDVRRSSDPDAAGLCYRICLTPEVSKSDFTFLKPRSPTLPVPRNNARDADYRTSGWNTAAQKELAANRGAAPQELKCLNNDWNWTKNQQNASYKRYSSGNMDGSLTRSLKCDADGLLSSVAPQYWTLGSRMNGRKLPLQDEPPADFSWTPRLDQPRAEASDYDYQRNVYIPGARPAPRSDLDVHNTFSTFGKKKKFASAVETPYDAAGSSFN